MSYTEFPLNDTHAREHWSNDLMREVPFKQYFTKFMGTSDNACIKIHKELEKQAGEKIIIPIRMKISGDGMEGDNTIEGTSAETSLDFHEDSLYIDQRRKSVKTKGKMTQQRVPYKLRKESRDALSVWFAEDYDQMLFMYLSGARGINTDFNVGTDFSGRANNDLKSPDSDHVIYGGDATGSNDLDSSDTMALSLVERLVAKIETMTMPIQPFMIGGEKKYVLLMHTWQAYQLRTSSSDNDWVDIQKNAGSRGGSNLLYKNALGEYADVILHKHRNVIRFDDYGAGGDVDAARALCLGAQAGIIAWGGARAGVGRYDWNEETEDRGNRLVVTAGTIYGCKKTCFDHDSDGTDEDFGVIAVDTYCTDPN